MSTSHTTPHWQCDGSAALSPAVAGNGLFVLEGGLGHDAPREAERPEARLARPVARPAHYVRFALASLLLLLALAGASFACDSAEDARVRALLDAAPTQVCVVSSGESLWSIASECAGGEVSVADLVSWICETNGLSTSEPLAVGQRLVVPVLE